MHSSKAAKLAKTIIEHEIRVAGLGVGEALPTTRTLAKRYGVSTTVVMNALSNLESQGYILRRRGSGCYLTPQGAQATPEPRDPRTVGLVMPMAHMGSLRMALFEGVESVCQEHGLHLVVANSNKNYRVEQREVYRLARHGCRGVVIYPVVREKAELENDYLREELRELPIVLVAQAHPSQGRPHVVFDNFQAGYDITALLLREGHRRIAFLVPGHDDRERVHRAVVDRVRGCNAAVRDAGEPPEMLFRWNLAEFCGPGGQGPLDVMFRLLEAWRKDPAPPTAVIAREDETATHLILAAQQMGIRVPGDLRVTGFDNLPVGSLVRPPFPTTAPDFRAAGRRAAELVMEMAANPGMTAPSFVLPAPLLRREEAVASPRPPG